MGPRRVPNPPAVRPSERGGCDRVQSGCPPPSSQCIGPIVRPLSRIERIRRALAARAIDRDWANGLPSWCESHAGVSLPALASALSEELQCDVPLGVLETMREDTYGR